MTTQTQPLYNYDTFNGKKYNLVDFPGPKVGDKALDFQAQTLAGETVSLSDYFGKLIFLETGSITCPQYVHRITPMNELAAQYPQVEFLLLYVREAHPGDKLYAHTSMADKIEMAELLVEKENENRTILVDDLEGRAHQAYGSLPNMVYIIGPDGTILFRADWNHAPILTEVLGKIAADHQPQPERALFRPVPPNTLLRVLLRAGWDATLDFFVSLPNLLGQHAQKFRSHKA